MAVLIKTSAGPSFMGHMFNQAMAVPGQLARGTMDIGRNIAGSGIGQFAAGIPTMMSKDLATARGALNNSSIGQYVNGLPKSMGQDLATARNALNTSRVGQAVNGALPNAIGWAKQQHPMQWARNNIAMPAANAVGTAAGYGIKGVQAVGGAAADLAHGLMGNRNAANQAAGATAAGHLAQQAQNASVPPIPQPAAAGGMAGYQQYLPHALAFGGGLMAANMFGGQQQPQRRQGVNINVG